MLRTVFVLSCTFLSAAAPAREAGTPVPVIVVPGQKVVSWPYRTLARGLAAFDRHRAMAPQAVLLFKVRARQADADLAGMNVHLAAAGWRVPLVVHSDGRFVLAPSERADGDNADVIINRRRDAVDPDTIPLSEVRTPGLPDHVRRLGDLRLACQVDQAIARKHLGLMFSLALSAAAGIDWCDSRNRNGRPATSRQSFTRAVLVDGARRLVLYEGKGELSVTVPIEDRSWAHDAVVELTGP